MIKRLERLLACLLDAMEHLDHPGQQGEDCSRGPPENEVLIDLLLALLGALLSGSAIWKLFQPRLNLTIEGPGKMNIGQTATATITPTAAGQPATVTGIAWAVTPIGAYTIVPSADGLSAVYTAAVAGTGNMATVAATNSAGTVLTDSAALPDVGAGVGVADALNLKIVDNSLPPPAARR